VARDRQRDDLAAEVAQAPGAVKATRTSVAGQNRKAAVTHQRRSPRSTRDSIQQNEDRQRDLITALTDLGGPVQHDLADRLHRCQQARDGRRKWSNHAGTASSAYPCQCRLFACWACRRSIIRRWEDKARRNFAAAANSACTVVSIVLASTTKIEAVGGIVEKARKDFANMRAAAYQQPGGWQWRSVQMFGTVCVDAIAPNSATLLRPNQSTLIPSFLMDGPISNTLWLLRANLAVHHPHLEFAELAREVTHQWPGSGRVDVHSFNEHQSAADNAADIVGHSLGTFRRAGVDGAGCSWPARWHAEYHAWLFGLKRGLQPLGISSRPQREKDVLCADGVGNFMIEAGWQGDEIEPMPMLF
jgi:hypothetical protein